MLKILLIVLTIPLAGTALAQTNSSSDLLFDPEEVCTEALGDNLDVAAVWAFGYLAHKTQRSRWVKQNMIADFGSDFAMACGATPNETYISVLNRLIGGEEPEGEATDVDGAGASDITAALLEQFNAPDLDLVAVLRSLAPTPQDIQVVFPKAMAANLVERYEEAFGPQLDDAGFPEGEVVVASTFTTTFELKTHPMLDEIQGGFKDVVDLYLVDVPFGEIVLAYPEIDDSVKLPGLLYVNEHWVIMPRPWRGIDD